MDERVHADTPTPRLSSNSDIVLDQNEAQADGEVSESSEFCRRRKAHTVPELAVVSLMSPPEGVVLEHLVLLEVSAHAPPLVVRQGVQVICGKRSA